MDRLSEFAPLFDLISMIATSLLALIAFIYTRKANQMNFILQSTKMLNAVNAEFLSSEENLAALAAFRGTPSEDARRDYLMLKNLNYLHAIWSLRQSRAISAKMAEAKLDNGAQFWTSSPTPYIEKMLDRGFPSDFQSEMKTRIASHKAL